MLSTSLLKMPKRLSQILRFCFSLSYIVFIAPTDYFPPFLSIASSDLKAAYNNSHSRFNENKLRLKQA